jgi:hypothetical protein
MSSISSGIHLVGQAINVVEHDGLTIEEIIGNVATRNDDASLALVTITNPTCEPWLTLHYDEWIHVLEGYIELLHHAENASNNDDDDDVANSNRSPMKTVVRKGQTVFIPKGSRMQPVFPVPAKYIPLCIPAFSPDRCVREEGTEGELSSVSAKLNELHQAGQSTTDTLPSSTEEVNEQFKHIQTIYHMCQQSLYDKSISNQTAYFPPTFTQDGRFTHASAVPATLLNTANHFYSGTSPANEEWICFELDGEVLEKKLGIVTTVFNMAVLVVALCEIMTAAIRSRWSYLPWGADGNGAILNVCGLSCLVVCMESARDMCTLVLKEAFAKS